MFELEAIYLPVVFGVCGLIGMVCCFFGFRLFKLCLALVCAFAAAGLLATLAFDYSDQSYVWAIGGFFTGALLGAVLAFFFYSLAVAIAGSLLVASMVLPWIQQLEFWPQVGVLTAACICGALLAVKITNLTIQLVSAFVGALLLVHSARFFISGEGILKLSGTGDDWEFLLNFPPMVTFATIALGLFGWFVQWRASS